MKALRHAQAAALFGALLTACSQPVPTLVPTLNPAALTAPASQPAHSNTALPLTATPTALPSATVTLAPSPTPHPTARQLTEGGCCVRPFWSSDGSQVRFIDRPSDTSPSGIWGVDLEGGDPVFVAARPGVYSPDESLVAYPSGGRTVIERVADGETWNAPSAGRPVQFSPDGRRIAWQIASSTVNFDRRVVQVFVSSVDGSDAVQVAQVVGGGLAGWFPDSQRLLITRRAEAGNDIELVVLDPATGEQQLIASAPRLRGISLSPQGEWLAYQVSFSGDANLDGQWVVRSDGTGARRLDRFGAYTWRKEGRLLLIPLEPGSASNRLLEVDATTGQARELIDIGQTPLRIAESNWSLSPDGSRLAFVAAEDHNIWLLDLPQP
jgi:Tol biopolymer transport system component